MVNSLFSPDSLISMTSTTQDLLLGFIPSRASLRWRLLKLAFLPLAVALPLILLVLALVGGAFYDARLAAVVRSNLATVHGLLEHHCLHIEFFIGQQLKLASPTQLLAQRAPASQLHKVLTDQAAGMRLDFLFIVDRQGRVLAASSGTVPNINFAESAIVRQAITGVLTSGFDHFSLEQLRALSPQLAHRATQGMAAKDDRGPHSLQGLMLLAAAPFPLSNDYADAVLCGGLLINNDNVLVDHIRDTTFPLNPGAEQINGIVTFFLGDRRVTTSIEASGEEAVVGTREPAIAKMVLENGHVVVQQLTVSGHQYLHAFSPIPGIDGKPLGMMAAGIPFASYRNEQWLLISGIASLLLLSMFGAALVFQRGTGGIVKRLEKTIATMKAAQIDLQTTRIPLDDCRDEITLLGAHFNELLDALQAGETAQEQARQEMATEAARRQDLFNHTRDGLVLLNAAGGIMEANPSFLHMLGYATKDLAELRIQDWDTRFQQMPAGEVASRLGESDQFAEVPYRRKDGSFYVAEVAISQIEWNNQRSYLLSIRDTTQIREMQRQLMQSQRLESLGEIAAGIAHEINSPMQFLLSNVSFMEESFTEIRDFLAKVQHGAATDEQRLQSAVGELDIDYLQEEIPICFKEMHDGIDRVVKIVAAMKEFSHPGGSSKVLTDINHLLDNTLIVCRNEWKYEAQVITCFDPELPKTLCFPAQLNQVLLNLIINACHAIQSRKEETPDHAGLISVSTTTSKRGIEIEVRDNGSGVPEAILHRIYDPFFTTKTVGKGTGQGLAIARDIVVNKHGGLIECESTPNQGTIFTLTLPLLSE